mmetsp:Transcript_90898/g.125353  ORF Transcript_90898/g.125353 Transcript_90898/m.125353 type:complete len:164 (+) Transcript_90898:222-713(+)
MARFKDFVLSRKSNQSMAVFSWVSDSVNYTNATICFGLAALFMMLCVFMLPSIVIMPSKFTMCFSLAMICCLLGLAYLRGPRTYLNSLFEGSQLLATCILLGSIVMSLYFSLVASSYLGSIIFCICQFNAILYFSCKTSAISLNTLRWMGSGLCMSVRRMLRL